MKEKNEKLAKNVVFLTLPIVLIMSRIGNDYVQIILGIAIVILCNAIGIYFCIKGVRSRLFISMMLIVNLAIGLCIAMSWCKIYGVNIDYLTGFFPAIGIIIMIILLKAAHRHFNKKKYNSIKVKSILIIIGLAFFQILVVYALFFRKR